MEVGTWEQPTGVSVDGSWAWDRRAWVPTGRVLLSCAQCDANVVADEDAYDFTCDNGHAQEVVRCDGCGALYQRWWVEVGDGGFDLGTTCPECRSADATDIRVREWMLARGRVVLLDFYLAAAGGSRIPNESPCVITFLTDAVFIDAPAMRERITYDRIVSLEASGSTTKTGLRVLGGGFGLVGAAEGMLAAAVVNSLSAHQTVRTGSGDYDEC